MALCKGYFGALISRGQDKWCCMGHILHIPFWYNCLLHRQICLYIYMLGWVGASGDLNMGMVDVCIFQLRVGNI